MPTSKKPSQHPTERAGCLLLGLARREFLAGPVDDNKARDVAKRALDLANDGLAKAMRDREADPSLFKPVSRATAVQQAALALQASLDGKDSSGPKAFFEQAVENHEGGPRIMDMGGPKIANKKTVAESWLRAAAIVLWKRATDRRDELTRDAIKLKVVSDRRALAKMVDNYDQGRLESLSAHMPLIEELVAAAWDRLSDFT